ncbi:MAG: MBL fold metallo-hydrolase [Methanoregula sp.]|jgi:glyoxylase-like metal-dependent hydrolase (beta-lactamase superfamily II)|uniref:MBL fold metallo-hydrolase n=1 Tax=Methanoregula sp. TaxID=2052170 RepID=UPI003D1416D2
MEIIPEIHQVEGVNGNCYVIVRDGLTIIDTGLPRNSPKILSYIRDQLHRSPAEIRTIILTHFHLDHAGNVTALKNASGGAAKVAVHEADAAYVSGKTPPPRPKGVMGLLVRIIGIFMKPDIFQPDILLNDGDRVEGLVCIHLPGHTPGSIGLLDEGTRTFFAGDTLRFDGKTLEGPPEQFTMDVDRARQSVRKIASLEFDLILSGHGVPLRPGASGKVREFAKTYGPAGS